MLAITTPHVLEQVTKYLSHPDIFNLSLASKTLRAHLRPSPPVVCLRSAHAVDEAGSDSWITDRISASRLADADALLSRKRSVCFALSVGLPCTKRSLITPARSGTLEAVKFLHSNIGIPVDRWIAASAARGNKLQTLRYLRSVGCEFSEHACSAAAASGSLICLKYLRSIGCPWNWRTSHAAALAGAYECLRWAAAMGVPLGHKLCSSAAASGSVETLKIVRKQLRLPWGQSALAQAARFGHVAALRWMLDNDCPMGYQVLTDTAFAGQLDCLHMLLHRGCPMHEQACVAACEGGNVQCLQTLIANSCPYSYNDCLSVCYSSKHVNASTLVQIEGLLTF